MRFFGASSNFDVKEKEGGGEIGSFIYISGTRSCEAEHVTSQHPAATIQRVPQTHTCSPVGALSQFSPEFVSQSVLGILLTGFMLTNLPVYPLFPFYTFVV
jgi:hypothetical protein